MRTGKLDRSARPVRFGAASTTDFVIWWAVYCERCLAKCALSG